MKRLLLILVVLALFLSPALLSSCNNATQDGDDPGYYADRDSAAKQKDTTAVAQASKDHGR
jgi:predicted small secreted protein